VESSQKDFSAFPEKVKDDVMGALTIAQEGGNE